MNDCAPDWAHLDVCVCAVFLPIAPRHAVVCGGMIKLPPLVCWELGAAMHGGRFGQKTCCHLGGGVDLVNRMLGFGWGEGYHLII